MAQQSPLRFGVLTYPEHVTYRDIVQTWAEIDAAGFDSAFVFDHFVPFQFLQRLATDILPEFR
jgi:alkanesulfonate monooxygenase SsuD/methylene tetrahydromethanopterin reductase-like flavin-dependent oxidoreductase (luciferase family)